MMSDTAAVGAPRPGTTGVAAGRRSRHRQILEPPVVASFITWAVKASGRGKPLACHQHSLEAGL